MTRVAKTLLTLLAALALFSAMGFAEAKAKKDTKQEHPSKLSKVAFWKHHNSNTATKPGPAKNSEKNKAAKVVPAKATDNKAKLAPAKATEKKAKLTPAKASEKKTKLTPAKAASAKRAVAKKESAPKQHPASADKAAVTPAAAKKPKLQAKATAPKANPQESAPGKK